MGVETLTTLRITQCQQIWATRYIQYNPPFELTQMLCFTSHFAYTEIVRRNGYLLSYEVRRIEQKSPPIFKKYDFKSESIDVKTQQITPMQVNKFYIQCY
jgi:hypothetical protein